MQNMPNLINYSTLKILESIRMHPGINLRGVITETKLSPNAVTDIINSLVQNGFLKERRLEKKRVYMRQFALNTASPLAHSLFLLVEEERKKKFYLKHPRLRAIVSQILQSFSSILLLVVYGSYAKGTETKESDLDILIVGSIPNRERLREILVTLEVEPSIKIESLADFKKKIADPLHREILRYHVLMHDTGIFLKEMLKAASKTQ